MILKFHFAYGVKTILLKSIIKIFCLNKLGNNQPSGILIKNDINDRLLFSV